MSEPSYHERQSSALCLKHALNNLLQNDYFSKADLDDIAKALPHQGYRLFNPHKWLCFGNYDVNVMILALEGLVKDVRWHDERDENFENVDFSKCWGLILNSQGQGHWFSGLTNGRHWHGIKKFQENWFSLDSVYPFPPQITGPLEENSAEADLREYLQHLRSIDSSIQVFVISEKKKYLEEP